MFLTTVMQETEKKLRLGWKNWRTNFPRPARRSTQKFLLMLQIWKMIRLKIFIFFADQKKSFPASIFNQ